MIPMMRTIPRLTNSAAELGRIKTHRDKHIKALSYYDRRKNLCRLDNITQLAYIRELMLLRLRMERPEPVKDYDRLLMRSALQHFRFGLHHLCN